jgi:hypothetical protein
LAFHLYPQLIRKLFHVHRFGPPPPVTEASPWPWVAHSVSGLLPPTLAPYSDSLSLRLRHASALTLTAGEKQLAGSFFNRHAITLLQALTAWRLTVSGLFHSPLGVLFAFPSRYWFTIGRSEYLALEGGPPGFPQGSSCPVVLKYMPGCGLLSPTGLSPAVVVRSRRLRLAGRQSPPRDCSPKMA